MTRRHGGRQPASTRSLWPTGCGAPIQHIDPLLGPTLWCKRREMADLNRPQDLATNDIVAGSGKPNRVDAVKAKNLSKKV